MNRCVSECENSFADAVYDREHCSGCCDSNCNNDNDNNCNCGCDERLCCDCNGECGCFNRNSRDPFWPDFSHPRTLPCSELYRCSK